MASPSVASARRRSQTAPDEDDIVLARALQFSEWARRNARLVIGATVVAAVVLASLFYYRIEQSRRAERAAADFAQLGATVSPDNLVLATRDLNAFITRFEGTDEADEARVELARLQLGAGQAAQAVSTLMPFATRIEDSPVGPQGALLLGAAQSQAGQTQAAIATYLRVAEDAPLKFQRASALGEAATLRDAAGNHAGAAEIYGRMIELTEPGSLERGVYEMRLQEAESQAGATPAPAPAAASGRG